ncbi:MAG: MFS transporter [Leptonema sp. (in: bacteria)]
MNKTRKIFSIVLLVLIAGFLQADQNLLSPNFPILMKEFSITEKELGLISSAFVFVSSIMTVGWGILSDFKKRKLLLLLGVFIGEIPCFLTAFVSNFYELFLMRMLTGIGIGSIIPIGYSLIADFFYGEERGRGYSYIETAFGLGTLMGMILAGLIPDWRIPFIIAAVPNFFLVTIFYWITPEPKRGQSERELESLVKLEEYQTKLSMNSLKKSLKTQTNQLIFLQGILGTVPWGIITTWFISFFIFSRNVSKETATFILLLIGFAAVMGSFSGGFLGDYFEKKIPGGRSLISGIGILIGMIFSILLILYPFPQDFSIFLWVLLALYSLLFIQFVSFAGPNVRAIVSEVNLPEDRGTVFGIFNILDNIGKSVGPLLGGFLIALLENHYSLSKQESYLYTMIFGMLFWLPCSLIWIFIRKQYVLDRDTIKTILKKRAAQ